MGYVDKNLMAGEEILLRPRYHPVRFLPGAIGIFRRIQNSEALRNAVFTRRAAAAAASPTPNTSPRTAEGRLADVERLFNAGSLTEGEYKTKRQELIKEL